MLTKKRTDPGHRNTQVEEQPEHRFAPDMIADTAVSDAEDPTSPYSVDPHTTATQSTADSPTLNGMMIPFRQFLLGMVICTLLGATIASGAFLALGQSNRAAIVLHPPPTALPTSAPTPTTTPAPITIFVSGAVEQGGLIELPADARVGDAIRLAGGLRADADAISVNQAAKLFDGAQVHIPTVKTSAETTGNGITTEAAAGQTINEPPAGISGVLLSAPSNSPSNANRGGLININRATVEELDALPGIGPSTAEKIIAARPYSSVDDLTRASGIGAKTVDKLRDLITVE